MKLINGYTCNDAGHPEPQGLYFPESEHDSCGVGFIAHLDGIPKHSILENSIQVLINLEHRGAIGSDKLTGDGAGLLMQMPDEFFQKECKNLGITLPPIGNYGVAMTFLPVDKAAAQKCMGIMEKITIDEGCEPLGFREVPFSNAHLGSLATLTQPVIKQYFIAPGRVDPLKLETKLYVIRRMIEKEVASVTDMDMSQFYICSFSSRTITYKGMITGSQLAKFFHDFNEETFKISYSIVHQRYSTNTLPTWDLAQPFRYLAHNGEINTLRGNINHMRAREAVMHSDIFGEDIEKLKPVIIERGSDSAIFDNALELLVAAGRSIPHALMMMIPEAFGEKHYMSYDKRLFYEYHATFQEPWDGPASMAVTDGNFIGCVLDRNGLRPSRYTITNKGLIVMASETGVVEIPDKEIAEKGRLQPGKMMLIDLKQKRIIPDKVIKARISRQQPYRKWVSENVINIRGLLSPPDTFVPLSEEVLLQKQHAFGYTEEEIKWILAEMASTGKEPVGSMGNDAALAVLSNKPQLLFNYFKQLFAQVTNPPIDPYRESLVMSLMIFAGRQGNILTEGEEHCKRLKLQHPILTEKDLHLIRQYNNPAVQTADIDILFEARDGQALEDGLSRVFEQAEQAIEQGATILILTDKNMDSSHAPIPVLLAVAGLHHHLIRRGLRSKASIFAETAEARETMHFALLLGYGATAICPYLAMATVGQLALEGYYENKEITPIDAIAFYIHSIHRGLLKTFSRMGISTLRSYYGAQIFEAVGLGKSLVDKYFTNTISRIGGIEIEELMHETLMRFKQGYPTNKNISRVLSIGGHYHARSDGEKHLLSSDAIFTLQLAVRTGNYQTYKEYAAIINDQSRERVTLRSLFKFKSGKSIPIEEVEPVEAITPRFVTAAMSYGSISKMAHESIAIALNRLNGMSNSGEGGEDPARYIPLPNGDSKLSRIKQVASGRFGVTNEYLANAMELQIKMAQGAKPGEGGQLPGHKVSKEIARVRHTTPGVSLISPPPHHDIYSIEDLAQLIYDLKCSNPNARVSVKLVSEVGVGTIASGVAKGKSDMVLISGYDGGTGASPITSILHAGLPWELGLSETQQSLVYNGLRDRIRVQVDGQLRTGRDLAIAALLGAEEFGFGTIILVTLGCILMRKCHMNNCPVGVATQNPELEAKFAGSPAHVEYFLRFIAQDLREYMAELGFRTVDEMVGRVDRLLIDEDIIHWKAKKINFNTILKPKYDVHKDTIRRITHQEHELDKRLDNQLIKRAQPALDDKEPVVIEQQIYNTQRTVATTLSYEVAKRYGLKGLPEDTIKLKFKGTAGQSMGAFLSPGITIEIEGDANDYFGKGLSGGKLIVYPPKASKFVPHENIIVGNVVLYGATSGEAYINGVAGERFCIRNSGATAVVECVGDHGCEYMTGGVVVCLGETGINFGAGMSGGVAYIYDENEVFDTRCNLEMIELENIKEKADEELLKSLIEKHYGYTKSPRAKEILNNWDFHLPLFVKVMPVEYRKALEQLKKEAKKEKIATEI